jgi:DNA (cytosine-5)-methyltransferase 1
LAEPYIIKFYGNGEGADSINDPLSTVTAKDRFALCIPSIGIALDIRFRMLQPHELAAAMSFKPDYEFTGNREQKVKQIGNAVPLKTAKALCEALLK